MSEQSAQPLSTSDGHHTRGDLKMLETAIRKRWVMPDEKKSKLPERLCDIALYSGREREQIAAARVIVAMEGQNQIDDHLMDKNSRLDSDKPTENQSVTVRVVKGVSMGDL